MAEEWYRQPVWTPEVEETFNAKIKRARGQKGSYFYSQAFALFHAGDHETAVQLCQRAMTEVAEPRPSSVVAYYRIIAAAKFATGDFDGAEHAFIAATEAHPPVEGPRRLRRMSSVGSRAEPETCRARLLTRQGKDPGEWPEWAVYSEAGATLENRPWRCVDLNGDPLTTPEDAAEYLVISHHVSDHLTAPGAAEAVFEAGPAGLKVIDDLVASQAIPGFGFWHFGEIRYLSWLGGYVGRVLVRQGGSWNLAAEVTDSTVETSNGTVDPFLVAWEAIKRGKPLTQVLE